MEVAGRVYCLRHVRSLADAYLDCYSLFLFQTAAPDSAVGLPGLPLAQTALDSAVGLLGLFLCPVGVPVADPAVAPEVRLSVRCSLRTWPPLSFQQAGALWP